MDDLTLVIITGLSGAGKTQALRSLEDLGFFCVDNLPPALIPKITELCSQSGQRVRKVALVIDIRGGEFFDSIMDALEGLEKAGFAYQILFLEADDETLVRRYKETRRRHPLAPHGRVLEGIHEERRVLEQIRGRAHRIIDTTGLAPLELREKLTGYFAGNGAPRLGVNIISFGFKHGLPVDADLVFDVRFLPNPHYVPSLRPLTGNNPAVREYVLKWPLSQQFEGRLYEFILYLLPHYLTEGKSQVTIGIGCTGGRHRSVVLANRLAEKLGAAGYLVTVIHRDQDAVVGNENEEEAAGQGFQ